MEIRVVMKGFVTMLLTSTKISMKIASSEVPRIITYSTPSPSQVGSWMAWDQNSQSNCVPKSIIRMTISLGISWSRLPKTQNGYGLFVTENRATMSTPSQNDAIFLISQLIATVTSLSILTEPALKMANRTRKPESEFGLAMVISCKCFKICFLICTQIYLLYVFKERQQTPKSSRSSYK